MDASTTVANFVEKVKALAPNIKLPACRPPHTLGAYEIAVEGLKTSLERVAAAKALEAEAASILATVPIKAYLDTLGVAVHSLISLKKELTEWSVQTHETLTEWAKTPGPFMEDALRLAAERDVKMALLKPGGWISDSLIDGFLERRSGAETCVCISPALWQQLKAHLSRGNEAAAWDGFFYQHHGQSERFGRERLQTATRVVLPACRDNHWALLWFSNTGKLTILDSYTCRLGSPRRRFDADVQLLMRMIEESRRRYEGPGSGDIAYVDTEVIQQVNNSDCGVFTVLFCRWLQLNESIEGVEKWAADSNVMHWRWALLVANNPEQLEIPDLSALCAA